MIGYKITASNSSQNYNDVISGWSEGKDVGDNSAKKKVVRQILKKILIEVAKLVVGGAAKMTVKVVDIVSKPLQEIGSGLGDATARVIKEDVHVRSAAQRLDFCQVVVTLGGSFSGSYRISTKQDLERLPELLALIPETGTIDQFMGAKVLESAYIAHANFLRSQIKKSGQKETQKVVLLDLNISL